MAGGWRYEAGPAPRVDYAERARKQAEDAYFKQYKNADRAGLIWTVRRVEMPGA